ncbi:MAG: hypothetical protein CH6_1025 [Candidatus Kapaibacterium sp.]|nr:MAG: hypothetical protein CH6_1025 [Candidatus Kapabacteria bacterium]
MKQYEVQKTNWTQDGLEPTYKELKPIAIPKIKSVALRLEPTYKELKLDESPSLAPDKPRLEPTYKELKQALGIKNWNKVK